jgi:hypothetical protein
MNVVHKFIVWFVLLVLLQDGRIKFIFGMNLSLRVGFIEDSVEL